MLAFSVTASAQLFPIGSQYLNNDYLVNPASCGSKVFNPLRLSYKKMMAGIDDAPVIQSASYHALISGPPNHKTMGMGGSVQYNVFGPLSKFRFQLSYAYHAEIVRKTNKLAIGFSLSAISESYSQRKFKLNDADDPLITGAGGGPLVPNASFGMYFYSDRYGNQRYRYDTYQFGLVVSNILGEPDSVEALQTSFNAQDNVRHYYLHGAYGYRASSEMLIEPGAMVRVADGGGMQVDINTKVYYTYMETGNVWGGLSFRTGDALAILAGITHQNLAIAYSYDITFGNIGKHTGGAHEITLGILLNRRTIKTL